MMTTIMDIYEQISQHFRLKIREIRINKIVRLPIYEKFLDQPKI